MRAMNLRDLFKNLSKDEREVFASKVGIKPAYLWQIATQWKGKKPSLDLLKKIADADSRLTVAELVEEFTGPEPGSAPAGLVHGVAFTDRRATPDRRQGPRRSAERRAPAVNDRPTSRKGR